MREKKAGNAMQISSRFTIAIHMLMCMDVFKDEYKITSDFLSNSIRVNPVIIRKLLSQLKDAGLIDVKRGTGGAVISRPLEEITFLDVYRAVDCIEEDTLFRFHENPNPDCLVGRNIHNVLDDRLLHVQRAMEGELAAITLEDVRRDFDRVHKD
ncbi:MAG: Rrf2 family transcriptional regulator [Bacteroides sp.]|nr:Rrf2 family transcriptional regulator [Bacteroides sp.]